MIDCLLIAVKKLEIGFTVTTNYIRICCFLLNLALIGTFASRNTMINLALI